MDTSILVPRKLPFKDEDLCSLLSNLLDNAMEAASQAGVAEPTVNISIIPRQEYLFIRVTNPVDKTLPEKRRMTLETTKPTTRSCTATAPGSSGGSRKAITVP